MAASKSKPLIAIACGGTGGHLYPGIAVAEAFQARGFDVQLLVSPKDVDQKVVQSLTGMSIVTLPATALNRKGRMGFGFGLVRSLWKAFRLFQKRRPLGVLAMGGFTSAGPILAGRFQGASTFVHESNAIPGRANRWLCRYVNRAFVGFSSAAELLPHNQVMITGTPVRARMQPCDPGPNRQALGLDPNLPTLLVQGGSQGARAINECLVQTIPLLAAQAPNLQFIHLTGQADTLTVQAAYAEYQRTAVVHSFLADMDLALGAATLAVSRAGASSLAEFAAMRVPAILIPYPHAADDHQFHNAKLYADQGAAWMIEERDLSPELLAQQITQCLADPAALESVKEALIKWHAPHAAASIVERIIALLPTQAGLDPRATT